MSMKVAIVVMIMSLLCSTAAAYDDYDNEDDKSKSD
jgi:hypothetical protein